MTLSGGLGLTLSRSSTAILTERPHDNPPRNVYLTHGGCLAALDAWLAVRIQRRWGLSGADGMDIVTWYVIQMGLASD